MMSWPVSTLTVLGCCRISGSPAIKEGRSKSIDLHAVGGLVPLLNYLKNLNAGITSRAAEVVSTIVQNNLKSQQQVMDCNGLEHLLVNFTSNDVTKVRTKALGAISSLVRHKKVAIDAFKN